VLPLVGGSWQWGFVAWSVPVAIIACLVMALAPRNARSRAPTMAAGRRWWPDWKNGLTWRLGVMLGTANAMYFATNAFLPDYLHSTGHPELISSTLTALNVGQLPASFLLLGVAGKLERRAWPYVVCGLVSLIAVGGVVFGSGHWIVAFAALLGFSAAAIFILALALPPLMSAPGDVHRVTAAMFTISYSCAVIVPIASGLAWDLTGVPAAAFLPIALCGLGLMAIAPTINRRGKGWFVS
jgi:CP family cyanate transporter-like MFS transporter